MVVECHAPHPHGRGSRLPEHPAARLPHVPGRRLGRLAHRHHRLRHSLRHARRRSAARPTWACWARTRSTSSSTATSRPCPRCSPSRRPTRRSWPYAKAAGAEGITLAGICCTANEILMRHGIPVAGNFLQQELAIVTGAVEMMIIDVQCCMPSLPDVAKCYHTEIVSTRRHRQDHRAPMHADVRRGQRATRRAKRPSETGHRQLQEPRPGQGCHPRSIRARWSPASASRAIKYMLGGTLPRLVPAAQRRDHPGPHQGHRRHRRLQQPQDQARRLHQHADQRNCCKRNVLVLKTGCAAIASAKEGLLTPEAALEYGRRRACARSARRSASRRCCTWAPAWTTRRILEAATEIVREGGLGDDLSDVPAVGVAPEWMSEKAIAIGCYFVASGVDVVLGHPFYIAGSENVTKFLNEETKEHLRRIVPRASTTRMKRLQRIMAHLERKREKLGINQQGRAQALWT